MATMDDVRAARAQAALAAHRAAQQRRSECEQRGHAFRDKRVWCLHCKAARNPAYPKKPKPKTRRWKARRIVGVLPTLPD